MPMTECQERLPRFGGQTVRSVNGAGTIPYALANRLVTRTFASVVYLLWKKSKAVEIPETDCCGLEPIAPHGKRSHPNLNSTGLACGLPDRRRRHLSAGPDDQGLGRARTAVRRR